MPIVAKTWDGRSGDYNDSATAHRFRLAAIDRMADNPFLRLPAPINGGSPRIAAS
jgi:hypothetical protein